jgi:macrolide transport system ATP-binding/permease protein
MRTLREWLLRLGGTLLRRRTDADLEQELSIHLEMAAEEARQGGHSAADAGRLAQLRGGGIPQALDALRDQRGLPWLDVIAGDAVRIPKLFRRHCGYVALATTTLAIAVGLNLVVFTVVNALWLKPPPFAEPDRLVTITDQPFLELSAPALRPFEAVAGQVLTSDRMAGLRPRITMDGVAMELETLGVTPEYFQLFGLAIRGRDFAADDDRQGAEPVAIISDRLWARGFDRRPEVIGAVLGAMPFHVRIIGVAPPGFTGVQRGEQADLWIPSRLVPAAASAPED